MPETATVRWEMKSTYFCLCSDNQITPFHNGLPNFGGDDDSLKTGDNVLP